MIKTTILVLLISAASFSTSAIAATGDPKALAWPEQYVVPASQIPAVEPQNQTDREAIEKPQSVSGSGDMVISPIFANDSAGNSSYIRFANPTNAASLYTVQIIGSPSGALYGSHGFAVPAFASPQYAYSDILTAANVGGLQGTDTAYAFYITSSNANAGFQHVIFNSRNSFFENASLCNWNASTNYSALNQVLTNVHTTTIAGYPSTVFVHNYANVPIVYDIAIYEATTGTLKGTVTLSAVANGTYAIPFSTFESTIGWTPAPNEYHANLIFSAATGSTYSAVIGQSIFNQTLGAYINMSQICGVNSGTVATPAPVVTTTSVVSQISGTFNGWTGSTIFPLTNGQVWQQSSYAYFYDFAFEPTVVIFQSGGGWMMAVEGANNTTWINVVRIQ